MSRAACMAVLKAPFAQEWVLRGKQHPRLLGRSPGAKILKRPGGAIVVTSGGGARALMTSSISSGCPPFKSTIHLIRIYERKADLLQVL